MAKRIVIPFATGGDKSVTPDATDPTGAVSWSQGWGPDYQRDNTDPQYKPVGRQEMNGIMFDLSDAIAELQAQGFPSWVQPAGLIPPYVINAQVRHLGVVWRSTVANNSTVPGAVGSTWVDANAEQPDATTVLKGIVQLATNNEAIAGENTTKAITPAALKAAITALSDPWAQQPLGVPIPVWDHLSATLVPPIDKGYRYIKLSAADAYNSGFVTSESVTGTEPLVLATGVIVCPGGALDGKTVRLINTERRFMRAAITSGEIAFDALQGHFHSQAVGEDGVNANTPNTQATYDAGLTSGNVGMRRTTGPGINNVAIRGVLTDSANGTARSGGETRPKSITAVYYMRVK